MHLLENSHTHLDALNSTMPLVADESKKLVGMIAAVHRKLPDLFLKPRLKICLFARVGNHRPRLRLHCLGLACQAATDHLALAMQERQLV